MYASLHGHELLVLLALHLLHSNSGNHICTTVRTSSILLTLLAPKTLWTMANLWGSSAGKKGAKMQSLVHRRRSSLHDAHGVPQPMCASVVSSLPVSGRRSLML